MPVYPPQIDFGLKATDFSLPATNGQQIGLSDVRGENGTLVMFICNHCPYVKAIHDRLITDALQLQENGIGVVAISSNDAVSYPADSFENMKLLANELQLPFPYLYDESQEVARAYDAVCTPDFFGYNADLELQYRGRLDSSGKQPSNADTKRELVEAMLEIAKTGKGPKEQIPSMGCSIKWKT